MLLCWMCRIKKYFSYLQIAVSDRVVAFDQAACFKRSSQTIATIHYGFFELLFNFGITEKIFNI